MAADPNQARSSSDRTLNPGKGGLGLDAAKLCLLCIEFQNEFAAFGGLLHGKVKANMAQTGMLQRTAELARKLRGVGVRVFHAPISFAVDGSDNPNKHLGILAGCDYNKLFLRGSWNAAICDELKPHEDDVIIVGKHGLSAFPDTTLEAELKKHKIETIALAGFMANCCVESTMRDACERGYNVITLTDCVATTSRAGWKAAVDITYPFFSTPMKAATFFANVRATLAAPSAASAVGLRTRTTPQTLRRRSWGFRTISENVYEAGPWFVDVRLSTVGEKLTLRSGAHELRRYLTFADASGMFTEGGGCALCKTIYAQKLPTYAALEVSGADGSAAEPFGWLCNMTVVRLPGGGCLLYSPIFDQDQAMDGVLRELELHELLPVRIILAPSPQHHLALSAYQKRFPEAVYLCGKASGRMPPLTKKRRDLRFDGEIYALGCGDVAMRAPAAELGVGNNGGDGHNVAERQRQTDAAWGELQTVCDVCVIDDDRTGEVVLRHRQSATLIVSDLLYKSNKDIVGPGGDVNHYSLPSWFANGQQELFYAKPGDNSEGLLPAYRTHPRMRTIDLIGTRRSLEHILGWDIERALTCHTDPITGGDEAKMLIKQAWGWVWREIEGGLE